MTSISTRAGKSFCLLYLAVVLCLVPRQSLIVYRGTVARLHWSSAVAKSKKPKNYPNSAPPNNPNSPSVSHSVPSQSKFNDNASFPGENEGVSSTQLPYLEPSVTQIPAAPATLSDASSAGAEPPKRDITQAIPSPQPARPEDSDILNHEQSQLDRRKHMTGPFSWKSALLFLLTGTGLVLYFRYEKERMDRLRTTVMDNTNGRGS